MVRINETNLFGLYLYRVFVDDVLYDKFTADHPMTWAQTRDVESYYKEALDNYRPAVVG
jgi:hypothetical protein